METLLIEKNKRKKKMSKTAGVLCGSEVKSEFSALCTCYVSAILDYSLQFFPFSSHSFTVYETVIIVLFQPSVV